jgi:two-component system cell cycle sensor histidine kinase/response regulator CckA
MTAGPTILVVDDDREVRNVVSAFLTAAGYKVVAAASGSEALAAFLQHSTIAVVLSDIVMPGMSGPELCDRLLRMQPRLKVLFMSGYIERADLGDIELLPKPFRRDELVAKIRALAESAYSSRTAP